MPQVTGQDRAPSMKQAHVADGACVQHVGGGVTCGGGQPGDLGLGGIEVGPWRRTTRRPVRLWSWSPFSRGHESMCRFRRRSREMTYVRRAATTVSFGRGGVHPWLSG